VIQEGDDEGPTSELSQTLSLLLYFLKRVHYVSLDFSIGNDSHCCKVLLNFDLHENSEKEMSNIIR